MWHPLCVMTSSELVVIMSQTSSRLLRTGVPEIPCLFFHTHHCWLEISTVTTLIGDTKNQTRMAKCSRIGHRGMITISYTTPNNEALFTQQGGNVTTHRISAGSHQSTVDPNQPPVLCSRDFPHSQHWPSVIHVGLRLSVMRGINKRPWNFRKADWPKYSAAIERSIPLIPVNSIAKLLTIPPLEDLDRDISRAWMKNVRFCLTSLRKLVTQKLLTTWSSHWMLLTAVVGKRQPSRLILQSQVARAGHSSNLLEPLKTNEEQAILRWKLTPSLITCFR